MKISISFRYLFVVMAILLASNSNFYGQKPLRVLSYNILEGLQGDTAVQEEFINWAKKIDPDIIGFQEMNNFTQAKIQSFAAQYGHNYAVLSKTGGYPVALTSKYPIVNVQKVTDNMHHVYLVANINNINVIVIHFSPSSYQKRQMEVKEILARADLFPENEMTLILGDFNSLSERDAAFYGKEDLNAQKEREKKESHIRNLNNGQFDYSVINAIEKAGFQDILLKFHKDFQPTFPTDNYKAIISKRIDFVFVNPELGKTAISAEIIRDNVTDKISDHYPVFVTFDLK